MTISGGIKFFAKSFADIDNEAVLVTMSSSTSLRDYIRDRRRDTRWISSGSNDATQESITIDLGASYAIDRLILVKHNFKAFNAQYWTGAAWAHFANVVTKEGTQSNITETAATKTTSYYEFTEVTTQKVRIQVDTTQAANAEKYVQEVVVTKEKGTFSGFPFYQQALEYRQVRKDTILGRPKFSIAGDAFGCSLTFDGYPTAADITLMQTLWQERSEFLIYPCGADASQFRFSSQGHRLEDIFLVWFDSDLSPNYDRNVYALGVNFQVKLVEVA